MYRDRRRERKLHMQRSDTLVVYSVARARRVLNGLGRARAGIHITHMHTCTGGHTHYMARAGIHITHTWRGRAYTLRGWAYTLHITHGAGGHTHYTYMVHSTHHADV
jgi:hypothetical protein